MTPEIAAEARIKSLGISDPQHLDIEAVAFDAGVIVEYEDLSGCAATLVGYGDRAIATIKPSAARGRERFSIAHELGHWDLHRGQSFKCRVDDVSDNLATNRSKEREADTYAAHLLMPSGLFNPIIASLGTPGFTELQSVASQFETSLLATALRLVNVNKLPAIVACYSADKCRWHLRARDIPQRWWLRDRLDDDSFAYELLTEGRSRKSPGKQPAETWFENDDAEEYEMLEHCISTANGEVLVLLYLTDAEMFDAKFDPNVGRKRW
jgi:Zn-dependent peptidase ImmA (M78 family)